MSPMIHVQMVGEKEEGMCRRCVESRVGWKGGFGFGLVSSASSQHISWNVFVIFLFFIVAVGYGNNYSYNRGEKIGLFIIHLI